MLERKVHEVDVCVVGGGLSGVCAAIAAARRGARTLLMQDRPMFGGNASSEIRMWVCGAHGADNRESGLLEELMLENQYRNPWRNYSIWDSVLHEKVRFQPNLASLLNCTCLDAAMEGAPGNGTIRTVTGWQMTTQTFHEVRASIFLDCSGDSILAPLTGAEFRFGREGRQEFGESIAPPEPDDKTMGMSCLIQTREAPGPRAFIAPEWAAHVTEADVPLRKPNPWHRGENYWYLELGGDQNAIRDAESVRDELQDLAYGMWDYVKNSGAYGREVEKLELDWVGMLPGKRESRRYVGDHLLTQQEVRAEGRFPDCIAYGGWSMDDHHPSGFRTPEPPTLFHEAPSPFGIPYRCLYSKNIGNLMFAGRNISVTHTAMSATRVMGTCALLGQAAGTAAALAVRMGLAPRELYPDHIEQLQRELQDDDGYLPFRRRVVPALSLSARYACELSEGEDASLPGEGKPAMSLLEMTSHTNVSTCVESLRNGHDRSLGAEDNGWTGPVGSRLIITFDKPERVTKVRVVFDSDLNRETMPEEGRNRPMKAIYRMDDQPIGMPQTLVRAYRLEWMNAEGTWEPLTVSDNNRRRLIQVEADVTARAVRLTPLATWGAEKAHVFSFDAAGTEAEA